jgi:Zn-dependent protease
VNLGFEFHSPVYNQAHRVSPWLKWSYVPAFLCMIPLYGIPASLITVALALKGVADMPYARRIAWGMAAIPLIMAGVTLIVGTMIQLGAGQLENLTLQLDGGLEPPKVGQVVVGLIAFLLSVGVHEPAHAMVAYWFGDTTAADHGRLTLNPRPHIHIFYSIIFPLILLVLGLPMLMSAFTPVNRERMHPRSLGDFCASVAGPLSNVLLAGLSIHLMLMCLMVSGSSGTLEGFGFPSLYARAPEEAGLLMYAAYFFKLFALFNIMLFVFNMLPVPGFDGGNAILALLPREFADPIRRNPWVPLVIIILLVATPIGMYLYEPMVKLTRWMYDGIGLTTGVDIST